MEGGVPDSIPKTDPSYNNDIKLIFVHVPKTGGSTLEYILQETVHGRRNGPMHTPINAMHKWTDKNPANFDVMISMRNSWQRSASLYVDKIRAYDVGRISNKPFEVIENFVRTPMISFESWIKHNDTFPQSLHVIQFDDYENNVKEFWKSYFSYDLERVPVKNQREEKYTDIYNEVLQNKLFQEMIAEQLEYEIEYFSYTI